MEPLRSVLERVKNKVSETAESSFVAADIHAFVNMMKEQIQHIDADVKDAKRRVNSAKGPRPKSKASTSREESSDSSRSD